MPLIIQIGSHSAIFRDHILNLCLKSRTNVPMFRCPGMCCHLACYKFTDVSVERTTSVFKSQQ